MATKTKQNKHCICIVDFLKEKKKKILYTCIHLGTQVSICTAGSDAHEQDQPVLNSLLDAQLTDNFNTKTV